MELFDARIILVLLTLCVCLLDSQLVKSTCDYFRYNYDTNGYAYGLIKVNLHGPVPQVITLVNFTVAASAPNYGSIEYLGLKDSIVTYKIHFPLQKPLPKVTRLIVNNNLVCQHPGDLSTGAFFVTSYSLAHQMTFGVHDLTYGFNKPSKPVNTNPNDYDGIIIITDYDDIDNLQFGSKPPKEQPNTLSGRPPLPPRPQVIETPTQQPENNRPVQESSSQNIPSIPPRQPEPEAPVYETTNPPRRPATDKPSLPVQVPSSPPLPPRPSFASQPTSSAECGIVPSALSVAPLVFQGDEFEPGDWPWLVAIYLRKGGSLQYICAGSLVSDMHVVTAAHCMQLKTLNSHKDIVVRAGVHNLEDWGDENSVTRTLASARIHESYTSQSLANDILVLTFSKRVEFTNYIRAICLWEGNNDQDRVVGKFGVVAGWGDSEHSRSGRGIPRAVRLKIVSTTTCRNSKPDFQMLTSSYTLCAGERNGAGPCFGDSGAGMYLREGGRWKLRGIVSLSLPKEDGEYNCNLDEYLVFTDAAQYLPWITDKMRS